VEVDGRAHALFLCGLITTRLRNYGGESVRMRARRRVRML
jgi:hypothetical protein